MCLVGVSYHIWAKKVLYATPRVLTLVGGSSRYHTCSLVESSATHPNPNLGMVDGFGRVVERGGREVFNGDVSLSG